MLANAASVALIRKTQLLLIQRARAPMEGLWTLPGGRLEPGETIEACAQREVLERPPPAPGTLVAWFQANGRPDGRMGELYTMRTTKSTRRLGGTKHFPPFESVASKLTLGMSLRQLNAKRR